MKCSRTLLQTDVRDMGRQLAATLLSPFLNTGVIFACLQSAGISPCCNEAWNIRVMTSDNSVANSFNNPVGMWSEPSALWGHPLFVDSKGVHVREQALPINGMLVKVSLRENTAELGQPQVQKLCFRVAMSNTTLLQWCNTAAFTFYLFNE